MHLFPYINEFAIFGTSLFLIGCWYIMVSVRRADTPTVSSFEVVVVSVSVGAVVTALAVQQALWPTSGALLGLLVGVLLSLGVSILTMYAHKQTVSATWLFVLLLGLCTAYSLLWWWPW